jgi:hypothetical protein
MDKAAVIDGRRKKHLAVLASDFERNIQPRIPDEVAQTFKALLRGELKTFSDEAAAISELDRNTELNDHAQAMRDTFEQPRV